MGHYICGIYEERPEVCKKYPESGSYVPESCMYYFADGERKGGCDPDCNASCCFLPRQGGEPGGAPMPEIAGGEPCKHITYVDEHPSRAGAVPSIGEADTGAGGDREEDRPVSDAIELVLAEKRRGERDRSGPA